VLAYQTAYLKANYPVEFFCAMMTNDMADTEKLSEYIAEARAMGIEVLPPDVNESGVHFAPAVQGGTKPLSGPNAEGSPVPRVPPFVSAWRRLKGWERLRSRRS